MSDFTLWSWIVFFLVNALILAFKARVEAKDFVWPLLSAVLLLALDIAVGAIKL